MSAPAEAPFVYVFAALLAIGSVVLLFIPVLMHIRLFSSGRAVFVVVVGALVILSASVVLFVTYAISTPNEFIPVAMVTAILRVASPTLLYRGIRDRFEAHGAWRVIRITVGAAFVALAGLLAYNLVRLALGMQPSDVVGLSEQFVMAFGASMLIVRAGLRFRPRVTLALWPIWTAATLFAIAFVVVAPYAFPSFEAVYIVSGLAGWIVAALIIVRKD
jgi:hypothetical protein